MASTSMALRLRQLSLMTTRASPDSIPLASSANSSCRLTAVERAGTPRKHLIRDSNFF